MDFRAARINAHQANIRRYCRLLATELTDTERAFVHRRIAEEQAALEQLYRAEEFSEESSEGDHSEQLINTRAGQQSQSQA